MIRILILAAVLFISQYGNAQIFAKDHTSSLSDQEISRLEYKLEQYEQQTSHEIVVRFIYSLDGQTIEDYANRLFNDLGIGKKDKNNGILILASKNDRKLRIEVGYGLEEAVPDQAAAFIIDEVLTPNFKREDYYEGFDEATDRIFQLIEEPAMLSEIQVEVAKKNKQATVYKVLFWVVFIIIAILLLSILFRGGGGGGLGGWTYSSSGGSSYSGGGGGFSFGGGSSGGGGASGSW